MWPKFRVYLLQTRTLFLLINTGYVIAWCRTGDLPLPAQLTTRFTGAPMRDEASMWNLIWFLEQNIFRKVVCKMLSINPLRPRQNGRHFADDIFKCIFLNENVWIPIKISMKFVSKGPINSIPALVQIMAWRRPGDKPLSEPMMVD